MMKYAWVLIGCITLIAGCTNKDKVPSDVLPKEEMGKVMFDMIAADRYASQFLSRDSSRNIRTETFKLYEEVFNVHKITRDEFIHSYKFYLSRPDLSKSMFDSVVAWAERRRPEVQKLDSVARRADSVRRNLIKPDSITVKKDSLSINKKDTAKKDTAALRADSVRRRANAALRKALLQKKK